MKIVLFSLNSSYTHTCLALRCLRNALEKDGYAPIIIEASLKDRYNEVLQELYDQRADIYGFSCYIWNIKESLRLAGDLKKLLPNCFIMLGGPEVSFDTERFDCKYVDLIIKGEGEEAIRKVCKSLEKGESLGGAVSEACTYAMSNEGILYREGDYRDGALLYYESSRGCPYNCSYCLSSSVKGVRAKSTEQTLCDLMEFEKLNTEIKVIKFVDRTFNFDIKRANAIWEALCDSRFTKSYHFEICASLLDEESFLVLSRLPKGKVQLEIGLQSTNPKTLAEVSRHIESQKVISAAARIRAFGNIHIHVDLIAGLPFEDMESFKQSFNEAYYCCDKLQLGFLKLLHGTALRRDAEKYGIKYSDEPPYQVLCTRYISRDSLYRLECVSDLLERYYSSERFENSLEILIKKSKSPFDFYQGLFEYSQMLDGKNIRKRSQIEAFRLLYLFAKELLNKDEMKELEARMCKDFSLYETRKLPLWVFE